MNRLCASVIPLLLLGQLAVAQVANVDEVSISLDRYSIARAVYPFDVPFHFTGSIPANCTEIRFSYKVSGTEKNRAGKLPKWLSLPNRLEENNITTKAYEDWVDPPGTAKSEYSLQYDVWKKGSGDSLFSLRCPGMHPNVRYQFMFVANYSIAPDTVKQKAIKQQLSEKLIAFVERYGEQKITVDQRDGLNRSLLESFKLQLGVRTAGQQLLALDGKSTYVLDINANDRIKPIYEALDNAVTGRFDARTEMKSAMGLAVSGLQSLKPQLEGQLESVLNGKTLLSPASKELLKANFTPGIKDFASYTYADGLRIALKLLRAPKLYEDLAKGQLKILNNDLVLTDKVDLSSLRFVHAVFAKMDSDYLLTAKGQKIAFFGLSTLTHYVGEVASKQEQILQYTETVKKIVQDFPDLTTEVIVSETFSSEVVSVADVVTEKTPYISAEAGLGYATAIGSGFRYVGANFYLVPVNKKARLSTFRGWNLFRKVTSFHLGVANTFGTRPANSYSLLGDAATTNLLVGVGFRTGRIVKLNLNWIPYFTNNHNPLSSDRKLKFDLSPSIGLDINLLGALGDVASLLNLK